jgi:hypothetical protein
MTEDKNNINNKNNSAEETSDESQNSNNSSSDNSGSDNSGGENLQQGTKTIIKKTGAYSELEVIEDGVVGGAPKEKNNSKNSTQNNSQNNNSATIDESQLGPSMGVAKDENSFTDPQTQDGKKGSGSKLKARLQNFIAGLGQDKINLRGEFKGDVNINDVKNSSQKETFESRLKNTEKQQEALDKTIENNANKNGVVRRVLAKLEEKLEKNPELAERFDTKAEVIKHVGHVPASQMSHVDKLVARAQEIQGKSPFDF